MSANGYLSDAELAPIDNGQRLAVAAAPRYLAMLAAAAKDGVTIRTTEGYRDYATQVYLYNGWINRLPGFNNASSPGYSPHGWGLASDLNTVGFSGTVYNWLAANAANYGFDNNVGRSIDEHWHWVYNGGGTLGFGGQTTKEGDKTMILRESPGSGTIAILGEGVKNGFYAFTSLREFNEYRAVANAAGIPVPEAGQTLGVNEERFAMFRRIYESKPSTGGVVGSADLTETNEKIDKVQATVEKIKVPTKVTGTLS